jgi:hypothetical protein
VQRAVNGKPNIVLDLPNRSATRMKRRAIQVAARAGSGASAIRYSARGDPGRRQRLSGALSQLVSFADDSERRPWFARCLLECSDR